MRGLRRSDWILLCTAVPLWLVGFGFELHVLATDSIGAWPSVVVAASESADGYPEVVGYEPWGPDASGLRPGDRLESVAGLDLRGAGPLRFSVEARARSHGLETPVVYERGGKRRDTVLRLRENPGGWSFPIVALSFFGVAVLVILRAPRSREAHAFWPAQLALSVLLLQFHGPGSPLQTGAWLATNALAFAAVPPLVLRAIRALPEEIAPRSSAPPWWCYVFSLQGVTFLGSLVGWPLPQPLGLRAHMILGALSSMTALAVQLHQYQRASPIGRRKIRWLFLSALLAWIPLSVGAVVGALDPVLWYTRGEALWLILALSPLCFFFAITRPNAFDIDRLITRTSALAIVLVALAGALVGCVPLVAGALGDVVGVHSNALPVLAGIGLAALGLPAYSALRPQLERLMFADQARLQTEVGALLREIDVAGLGAEGLRAPAERIAAMFGAASLSCYERRDEAFGATCAAAGAPASFARNDPLIATLRPRIAALAGGEGDLFENAALEQLGATVVVPVRCEAQLDAFIGLGHKRSGDVYTPTDLALLTALGQALSSALERAFAASAVQRGAETQRRLRRYVPTAIADRVESGSDFAPERRDVSVLFVDIRGYSAAWEGRAGEDMFEAVSRYTELVSSLVRRANGTIVEFGGDGMMAVFGAPESVPEKESRAVQAALEIAAAVGGIRFGTDGTPLRVGIGIASGEALVGSVRSADRLNWTALGPVTNLASRLQALTRELGSTIVIDGPTHARAGALGATFQRHAAVSVRGLEVPLELWSLT
jgi:class 3 adenylate cyclase